MLKKDDLAPDAVIKWVQELKVAIIKRRLCDNATQYQVRYILSYIEKLVKYQEVMPPKVEEDERFFTCTRCNHRLKAESGTAEDYMFCPLCGQRWKDD